MKVKLLTRMAGPNGNYEPGEHDFPDELATQLIKSGYAINLQPTIDEEVKEEVPTESTIDEEVKEEVVIETPSSRRKLKRER